MVPARPTNTQYRPLLKNSLLQIKGEGKAALLKTEYFQRNEATFRKVTGAVSDFRPRYGSVSVGAVKPRRPCLPLFTSPAQARDEVIHTVGMCVYVFARSDRRKKSDSGHGPRQEKR